VSIQLYPPNVTGVPADLTRAPRAYTAQVVLVLICLLAFLALYFGLLGLCGWIVLHAITAWVNAPPPIEGAPRHDDPSWVLPAVAALVFLFMVKSLFHWKRSEEETRIEITEKEQPDLFRFVRHICADTGAPSPYRIFLSPDVNAAVFYHSSLLNLIFPVRKNLLIGLGLVNSLTLSEFKAVLAHEFGHFSQNSMRLGNYVYVANRVMYDIVFSRDALDDLLRSARRTGGRIAVLAIGAGGVVWLLRQTMAGSYRVVNFFQSALSRQMEYQADLVAVSVTGSDSLIYGLKKLDFASACLGSAVHELSTVAERKIYTRDLYYHQTHAADYVRREAEDPTAGLIPALPADGAQLRYLFKKDEKEDRRHWWDSHPTHYERERNVKRRYIRSVEDDRSPWILFRNADDLRWRMTELIYQKHLDVKKPVPSPPEEVQAFIDSEHEEIKQDARYRGLYDGRLLRITPEQLEEYAAGPVLATLTPDALVASMNKLYNAEYAGWLQGRLDREKQRDELYAIRQNASKRRRGKFEFRGKQYQKSELESLAKSLDAELTADNDWFAAFDREIFQAHLRMAQIADANPEDLLQRYRFQIHVQKVETVMHQEEGRLLNIFRFLASKEGNLGKKDFQIIRAGLDTAYNNIRSALMDAQGVRLLGLQNVDQGTPLNEALLPEPLVGPLQSDTGISGEWVAALGRQTSEMEERCRRLYFKSIGAILQRQEAIAEKYRTEVVEAAAALTFDLDAG
jgi:Zn-dependent protease with chaperone function